MRMYRRFVVTCFELFIILKILTLYCWERLRRSLQGCVHEALHMGLSGLYALL